VPQQLQGLTAVATLTDPLGRTTSYTLDLSGRPVAEKFPDGTVHQWLRNAAGQVVVDIDPLGLTTAYTYDPTSGDLLQVVQPDGGTWTHDLIDFSEFGNVAMAASLDPILLLPMTAAN